MSLHGKVPPVALAGLNGWLMYYEHWIAAAIVAVLTGIVGLWLREVYVRAQAVPLLAERLDVHIKTLDEHDKWEREKHEEIAERLARIEAVLGIT